MIKHLSGFGTDRPLSGPGAVLEVKCKQIRADAESRCQNIRDSSNLFSLAETLCDNFSDNSSYRADGERFAYWTVEEWWKQITAFLYLGKDDEMKSVSREVSKLLYYRGLKIRSTEVSSSGIVKRYRPNSELSIWKDWERHIPFNVHIYLSTSDNSRCRMELVETVEEYQPVTKKEYRIICEPEGDVTSLVSEGEPQDE